MVPRIPGVSLRPLEPADAAVIAAWGDDPEYSRTVGWRAGLGRAELQPFFERMIATPARDLLRLAAISGDDLVGYVDLHGSDPARRELGFLIGGRSRWGRGLGGEAAAAGLGHGFDGLGLHEIWAEAFAANTASIRILQALGMAETGRGRDGVFLGESTYYRRFAISADTWADRQSARETT